MPSRSSAAPSISQRALNRATLARQGLLARQPVGAAEMLHHLVGMQAQVHNAPYVGLWSRLTGFRAADLETLLLERKAVRATLMRVTLHLALADDFLAIRPLIDPLAWRGFRTNHLKPLRGADVDEIRAASRRLLDSETLAPVALGERLAVAWPDVGATALSMPARFLEPVVHVPPAGLWGATRPPELTSAQRWLGRSPGPPIDPEALMLRYLAAFGPATGKDFGAWSGLSGGPALLERLRSRLVSFTAEDGRELFDLPDAPRPDEDVAAPVRLLPDYDNVLLGYADRSRVMSAAAFKGLWRANGLRPAFMLDGMVRGAWKLSSGDGNAAIRLSSFAPLQRRERAELEAEAEALLAALLPGRRPEIAFEAFEGG
jgi:hypothetical protein